MKQASFAFNKCIDLIMKHSLMIKASIVALMGFIAFFVTKDNSLNHWSWVLYIFLAVALLIIEFIQDGEQKKSPLEKVKEYIENYKGWQYSGGNDETKFYKNIPEYTIKPHDGDSGLGFSQEWMRGEIGLHYNSGNSAFYMDLFFHSTLLKQIHIVLFDGGHKIAVEPAWEAIGEGRIYYYLLDSLDYAYQKHLVSERNVDYSKGLRKFGERGEFDIPVFKDKREVEEFKRFCSLEDSSIPTSDLNLQNSIFYNLLAKYEEFKNR